ncbi:unnamed protein product, partial [Thlaspi arvense]
MVEALWFDETGVYELFVIALCNISVAKRKRYLLDSHNLCCINYAYIFSFSVIFQVGCITNQYFVWYIYRLMKSDLVG